MKRSDEAVAVLPRKIRFGFAVGLSLVIAGGIGLFLWHGYRSIETRAYAETAVVARTVVAQMAEFARYDYLFAHAQKISQRGFAQGKPVSSAPLQTELALWQHADPEIVAVRLADASGRLIDQPPPISVADRADFRLHRDNPNLGWPITGRLLSRVGRIGDDDHGSALECSRRTLCRQNAGYRARAGLARRRATA